MDAEVTAWIEGTAEPQRSQLSELRSFILEVAPHTEEKIKWGQPCYTQNALFCCLARAKTSVKIGFQQGVKLIDPAGVLCGEGKRMRHAKFLAKDEINPDICQALIREAVRVDSLPS